MNRNILFLLFVIVFSGVAIAQEYTAVPDPKFEAQFGLDKEKNDGKVLTSVMELYINLEISNKGITDLTGIEACTNLERLDCSFNLGIKNIPLASNLKLTSLDCSFIGLKTLDLTNNIALTNLKCDLNGLTAIDLTKNINLETLSITRNFSLTSLDVSRSLSLKELQCQDNKLKSLIIAEKEGLILDELQILDATNNPDLICIQVNNEKTAIDKTNNDDWKKDDTAIYLEGGCGMTLIPDANFETALNAISSSHDTSQNEPDGKVFTADISNIENIALNNRGIKDLTGIQDFKNLKTLNISTNPNLGQIDLSQNLKLVDLTCPSNGLTSINLSQNTELERLLIQVNALRSLDLSKNTKLRVLRCQNNNLSFLDLKDSDFGSNPLQDVDARFNNSDLCIQIQELLVPPAGWKKDASAMYSTNCGVLSTDNFELNNQIKAYPNPTNGIITISGKISIDTIEIYDLHGNLLKTFHEEITTKKEVDLSALSKGIYFMKITAQEGKAMKRIILQ